MIVTPTRPALRYHGGKWLLAPWVIRHFPVHRFYVEPFGGAASVLMRKPRSFGETYNDIDGEIVNVFRVLRDPEQAARLRELVRLTPFARAEWSAAYEPAADTVERARRTMVRSQMGFGSDSCNSNRGTGFRAIARLDGSTPASSWARIPDSVEAWTARMSGVAIENRPALDVIADQDGPGTLYYCDPPYPHSTRSDVRSYSHEMSDGDHRGLAEVLRSVAGYVLISGYRCELYDELYPDWERVDRPVIVFRASRRVESLWLSPRTSAALQPTLF